MRIALVQQHCTKDKAENRERGLAAARRSCEQGAQVVCFAELAFEWFYPQHKANGSPLDLAESVPGETTEMFAVLAREFEAVMVLNLYERDEDRAYDTTPVIGPDGSLLGRTRMIHITDYECFHERDYYHQGDRGAPVYDTPYGKIGVAICYDRHYPEYMRKLAIEGAEVVIVPQAGALGEWPEGLYHAEMRVASFQNGYFTALCNRVGKEDCLEFGGESFICNPRGDVIAELPASVDDVLICDLDLDKIKECEARQLFIADRRPDLYAQWFQA